MFIISVVMNDVEALEHVVDAESIIDYSSRSTDWMDTTTSRPCIMTQC
jgi:hypothetical protein